MRAPGLVTTGRYRVARLVMAGRILWDTVWLRFDEGKPEPPRRLPPMNAGDREMLDQLALDIREHGGCA